MPESGRNRAGERLGDRVAAAALEAELATGEREETIAQARAHILIRLGRMSLGTMLCAVGLVMFVTPGPGWLMLAAGLAVLSRDVAWADRLLQRVRHRLPQDADGRVPRPVIATMIAAATAGLALSLWFLLR